MMKSLGGIAPAYLSDLYVGTAAVLGRSGFRSAVRGDRVVPVHRIEWGLMTFAVAGLKCGINCRLDSEICLLVLRFC